MAFPMSKDEVEQYIAHRLQVAGGEPQVGFTSDAIALVHRHSRGVPRAVNLLCDRALEEARGVQHSLILFRSERWLAPGHNCIIADKAGDSWILYHAIDVNRPRQRQEDAINSRRILLIDKIHWHDGWPYVGTPSDGPRHAPVT